MTTLAAKGYTTDGVPVFLWAYGNYKYEIEVKITKGLCDCEVMDTSYEEAFKKFEGICVNGEVSMPINS